MFKLSVKPKEYANEPEATRLEEMNGPEDQDTIESEDQDLSPEVPSRFFYQVMITGLCLAMLVIMSGMDHPWIQWAKGRIHNAIFASSESTFGYLANWGPFQSLLQNGKNLFKLEEITKQLSTGEEGWNIPKQDTPNVTLSDTVWPAQGSVSRSFGWQYNPAKKAREFNDGIEISAAPGIAVQALTGGQVGEVSRQPDTSWQVTLNHGSGWISIYRNLGLVKVRAGETIPGGTTIGTLNTFGPSGSKLWMQVKHNGQPVDPLTLFAN